MKKSWLVGVMAWVLPAAVLAGGFELPDVGARALGRGASNVVGVRDLTALHYNPGALAKLKGTRFMWHHQLVMHDQSFQRAPIGEGWLEDTGQTFEKSEGKENFFGLGGFLAASSDFGLDDWTFAIAVYGPSAVGNQSYETYGAVDQTIPGDQRPAAAGGSAFQLVELETILVYYSAAAAWSPSPTFGIGVTLQYVDLQNMEYELVVDGGSSTFLEPTPDEASTQLSTRLMLEDRTGFTTRAGVWWRPIERLELAAAGRVMPIELEPSGGVAVDKPDVIQKPEDALKASFPLTLPMTASGGARYIHPDGAGGELFDIELGVYWENWSVLDAYDVSMTGRINGLLVEPVNIPKAWRDTVSVRLGGDWNVIADTLTLRAGGYWENGAVPENYEALDFQSYQRFGVGGGLTYTLPVADLGLTIAYLHVFQEDREVDERSAKFPQARPVAQCPDACRGSTGVPANAGKYTASFDMVTLGLDARFDWFD